MSTKQELLQLYEGQVVPRAFNAGFVIISYIVSLTGAASTLELLNRRTSRNGLFNHVILFSAAVTMGGIAIWCMHFIGNRAIVLGHDEFELQIAYSSGFTALSFFLPIFVLLTAFIAIGAHNKVPWWRICGGGTLAGLAICGMHYLGNASIDNYTCIYDPAYVVGAVLIAVLASTVALSLFFVFRASWTNTWWKRGVSAVVLAGAVSGMHWCASIGTKYRLIRLNESSQLARTTTVIVVICLSISAAFIIAGTIIYTAWAMRGYANKAQQIVLAAAIFDKSGRILVSTDGLLPSEKITDTYVERTQSDTFDIAHPLFHWMFQASRNWKGVSGMITGMTNHLAHLSKGGRDRRIRLINDNGQPIENYDIIFRELFCLAAANLADKMKEPLSNVGILWDEILATGAGGMHRIRHPSIHQIMERGIPENLAEKGESWTGRQQEYGRGSLMFLARRLDNSHDVERLQASGFRFADIRQVCGIIGSSMQIKTRNLGDKLMNMATFAEESTVMEPGVHLSFFGVRARVGSPGFDVLVKRGSRNLLPSMQIPLERLESWQMDIVRHLDRMSVPLILQHLDALKKLSPREMLFASQLADALEALRAWIDDPIFDEAVLTSKVVHVPCHIRAELNSANTCTMIALRLMIPIHDCIKNPKCEFIPLNFFKVHQMVYRDSPQHAAFTRYMHRELSPILKVAPVGSSQTSSQQAGRTNVRGNRLSLLSNSFRRLRHSRISSYPVDEDGNPIPTEVGPKSSSNSSDYTSSTSKLWNQNSSDRKRQCDDAASDSTAAHWNKTQEQPSSFGGILVSQEIKVDVRQAEDVSDSPLSLGLGRQSYCHGGPVPGGGPSQRATNMDRITLVKAGRGFDMEMKALSEGSIHAGTTLGSAVIESEKVNEVMTFVDELFAVCVDGR